MPEDVLVNDVHSALNPVRVARVVAVDSLAELQEAIRKAHAAGQSVCTAGARHAMGAQQFGSGAVLLDTRRLDRVLALDREQGLVEVEAGIQWPALIKALTRAQAGMTPSWAIRQKQTGADGLSLGGALAANVHGRGLRMKPIIDDVESIVLVGADGNAHRCSRHENRELFCLAIGGYGLFGVIYSVTLRLAPRRKVQRVVEILHKIDHVIPTLEKRIEEGYLYGDFQFDVDDQAADFLRRGVCACYRPVPDDSPIPEGQQELSAEDWMHLAVLGHTDKAAAYQLYTGYYLATSGQVYWSDTHQQGYYLEGYHRLVDELTHAPVPGSEMISELYVPRSRLPEFMAGAACLLRRTRSSVIYGTVRLIEADDESFLAWAKQSYACVVFNLHVDHHPVGIEQAQESFRGLIDLALAAGGSFYLTYHKFATRRQVEAAYPEFVHFLEAKRRFDPDEVFQSDWYRHYRALFGE